MPFGSQCSASLQFSTSPKTVFLPSEPIMKFVTKFFCFDWDITPDVFSELNQLRFNKDLCNIKVQCYDSL